MTTEESIADLKNSMLANFKTTFEELHKIKRQNAFTVEHVEYIHENTLATFRNVIALQSEVKHLEDKIKTLQTSLDQLHEAVQYLKR